MEKKPYVVEYTITYRNACLVYAENEKQAEQDALELYGNGWFDPEDNGYDGCDTDVSPATPEQEQGLKWDSFDWEAICKEHSWVRELAG